MLKFLPARYLQAKEMEVKKKELCNKLKALLEIAEVHVRLSV